MPAHSLKGQGASPGFARGPAHVTALAARPPASERRGDDARLALSVAVRQAVAALERLAAGTACQGADLLDVQVELLNDPALLEPAFDRIGAGADAAEAWRAALDDYIGGFESADDERTRARAADLRDIRDRVLAALAGNESRDFPLGSIFVGKDMAPSLFLSHDWSGGGGIVLFDGSPASHVAMLARNWSVPMVVGVGRQPIAAGDDLAVDGQEGTITVGQGGEVRGSPSRVGEPRRGAAFSVPAWRHEAPTTRTLDGAAATVLVNIATLSELRHFAADAASGIGLLRTEFLIGSVADLTDEERQLGLYRSVLDWAKERPVTARLFDLGGDKPLPGVAGPELPFSSGARGIRFLLGRRDILRTQIRALLRAASHGDIQIMIPMVAASWEVDLVRRAMEEEAQALARRGIGVRLPPLGMMVEVPAAALMLDRFGSADFFSFGTNDLAQYLAAAARDDGTAAPYLEAVRPAVLRLLAQAMPMAEAMGKPASICGDMAGDPSITPALLAAGLRSFSVAPSRLAELRERLAGLDVGGDVAAGG